MASGTPAADEFHTVMRRCAGNVELTNALSAAWVSIKLFERATVALPEPATANAILQGLWSIKNDDLGGLTQPLTVQEGQNAKGATCWFLGQMKNKEFSSPDGYERHCLGD